MAKLRMSELPTTILAQSDAFQRKPVMRKQASTCDTPSKSNIEVVGDCWSIQTPALIVMILVAIDFISHVMRNVSRPAHRLPETIPLTPRPRCRGLMVDRVARTAAGQIRDDRFAGDVRVTQCQRHP